MKSILRNVHFIDTLEIVIFQIPNSEKMQICQLTIEMEIPFLKPENKIKTRLSGWQCLRVAIAEYRLQRTDWLLLKVGLQPSGKQTGGMQPQDKQASLGGECWWKGAPPAWPAHNSFLQKRNSLCSSSYCVTSSSSNLDILFVCENHAEPPEMGINVYGAFFARSQSVLLTFFPTGEWRAEGVVPWGSPCNWQGSCAQSFFL